MLPLLFSLYASANPGELTFALQRYNALAGRKLLVVASGSQALDLANKCKKIDPMLDYYVQGINKYSDLKREIKKAQTTYGAKCALHLSIEKKQWKLRPYGVCYDPNRKLFFKEEGNTWSVIDNKDRTVRAIDFAVLTKDEDLLRVLKNEESQSYNLGQSLFIGSAVVAGTSIIPLLFGKNEELAQLEDRRWTAVFLLGSGYMLYEASKQPPLLKKRKTLSNYRPKSMVIERIDATWPPPEPVFYPESPVEEIYPQSIPEEFLNPPSNPSDTQPPNQENSPQKDPEDLP